MIVGFFKVANWALFMNTFTPPQPSKKVLHLSLSNTINSGVNYSMFIVKVGTVVCGMLIDGVLSEDDRIRLGPDRNGAYHVGKVDSIRRNKQPVRSIKPGQAASVALSFEHPLEAALADIRRVSLVFARFLRGSRIK